MGNIITDIETAAENLVKHLVSEEAMLHLELQGIEHQVFAAIFTGAVHVAAGAGEAAEYIDKGLTFLNPLLAAAEKADPALVAYVAEAKAASALLRAMKTHIEAQNAGSAMIQKALPAIVSDVKAFVSGIPTATTVSGRAVQMKG